MKNLPFVIWMIGFPLLSLIEDIYFPESRGRSGIASVTIVFIWIFVGILLYEN